MPALVDARPAGIDLLFRPATTLTLTLNWPAGSLAGRTFSSTLNGVTLTLGVVGDVMTISASVAQTAAVTAAADWVLTETTGDDQPILVGTWAPSNHASAVSSSTVNVTQGSSSVDVTVFGSGLVHIDFTGLDALLFPQGGLLSPYPLLTPHDAYYWWPADFLGNATINQNAGTLALPPVVEFPNTSTTRIKWVWNTGIGWEDYTVKFGYARPGSTTGVATFKYYEAQWAIPGFGGTSLAVTPTLHATVTTVNLSTMTANYASSNYVDIVTKAAANGFVLSILEMDHDDVTTTLNGPVGVYGVTATRV